MPPAEGRTCRITVFLSEGGCSPRMRDTSSSFWALWSLESVCALNVPSSSWTPNTARASPALAMYLHTGGEKHYDRAGTR